MSDGSEPSQRRERIAEGYDPNPARSYSLHSDAYTEQAWFEREQRAIFACSWQWVCHQEALTQPGSYVTATVAGDPIVVVRDNATKNKATKNNATDSAAAGHNATNVEVPKLRAFYNVCKHRAHELLSGAGQTRSIVCPYHAWTYNLSGKLTGARHTQHLEAFDTDAICLDEVRVETFGGFVYVNLDPEAAPLNEQAAPLGDEIAQWAPDVEGLTFAHRLTYEIESNWKNVVDNFLECYHCHVAHEDFVSLVEMDTYTVTTHEIHSSHMAEAGKTTNTAYSTEGASVTDHAVWWLWPNTCLLRYPGRGNFIVMHIVPVDPNKTRETYDFFLETPDPNEAELESIRYIDEVLQPEDIALVESVQRGMSSAAFTQGRIVADPNGSGLSEHAVHHFHGLVLDAYEQTTSR